MSETIERASPWPNGAQCAVMFTFDFDAETLWISRDPANWKRPGTLSQGTYGAKAGVPKILDLLREYGLKATFFVPGWTAEKYRDRLECMLRDGHEIGHHGYLHEWIDPEFPELEREALEKGLAALKAAVGVIPSGFRSPAGETSENMAVLLTEHKFLYDSSLQDDINPYQLRLANGAPGPIELPWHWSLDDAPYMLFSLKNPRPIMTNSHVLEIWQAEFQEIYRGGGLFNLVCHPQVTGRPSRLALLREFIEFTLQFPRVWYATGRETANTWLQSGQIKTQEFIKIG
ncbi:MAG TPA: polysaccharide deacetylase [Bryobacteraceae bacterium]|nr:polysaccharide deacetylase [Bryobacteraceae bacterium]